MTVAPKRDFDTRLGEALRALPLETPPRSAWPQLAGELARGRRASRWPTWMALAAALLLAVAIGVQYQSPIHAPTHSPQVNATASAPPNQDQANESALAALGRESAELEALLTAVSAPDVASASHAAMRVGYQHRMQLLDQLLAQPDLERDDRLALWQERVGLLRQRLALETGEQHLAARGGENAALVLAL